MKQNGMVPKDQKRHLSLTLEIYIGLDLKKEDI